MSGKTVITAICEINGCFGHIGRDGLFLKEMIKGLYPSNTLYPRDDLYPRNDTNAELVKKSYYVTAKYEDYVTEKINKLQIRQEEDDIGCIYGEGNNCYIVQDNFLVYGKSPEELQTVAANLYSVISKVWYRPAHVEAKGNPCLEVGDGIKLNTAYQVVYTYILQRTLKGIQALRDTYDAEGKQYQTENVNSMQEQILQLKGKTNKLTRTVEETRLEITDIQKGLSSRITQTADAITAEVIRATKAEGELSGRITVNADSITAEVKRAATAEGDLSSRITQNAKEINLRVSKGSIISEINQTAEAVTISASRIDLNGLVSAAEFTSKYATITELNAISLRVIDIETDYITAEEVHADYATIGELDIVRADVATIKTNYISANEVISNYATINALNAANAKISNLDR